MTLGDYYMIGIKRKIEENDLLDMTKKVSELMNEDYELFCMSLMSIETFNDDVKALSKAYEKYIRSDESLINERIIENIM